MPKRRKLPLSEIRNIVVVSDVHAGCRMALCPNKGIDLDDGGHYTPSTFQHHLYGLWDEFWGAWVPHVTKGEPYAIVVNGDVIDGSHHGGTTQISHNLEDQARIAKALLEPVIDSAAAYFHIRGTEAHVGKSGVDEERIAQSLGAIPDTEGRFARWEMWHEMPGPDGEPRIVHFNHHIGTSGSSASESGALGRELVEMYVEAGRWGERGADVIVRSHRHRYSQYQLVGARGLQIACVTPAWQGKTPFTYKINGRMSPPQFGGLIIRTGSEGLFTRARVWTLPR